MVPTTASMPTVAPRTLMLTPVPTATLTTSPVRSDCSVDDAGGSNFYTNALASCDAHPWHLFANDRTASDPCSRASDHSHLNCVSDYLHRLQSAVKLQLLSSS